MKKLPFALQRKLDRQNSATCIGLGAPLLIFCVWFGIRVEQFFNPLSVIYGTLAILTIAAGLLALVPSPTQEELDCLNKK